MIPTLIYCAAGNKRFAEIAINSGYRYGAQLPDTIYFEPYFIDQDWHNPNRSFYMGELAKYKPHIATVLDWEYEEQYNEIMSWVDEASQFINVVIVIPKVNRGIKKLPLEINNKEIRLGYSVPTKYAGTTVPIEEFLGRTVHLLGGSPGKQMKLAKELNVLSVDGNMAHKLATRFCLYWVPGKKEFANKWLSIRNEDGTRWNGDGPYEAFRRSCENIKLSWEKR